MPEPLALDLHRRYEAEKLLHSTDVVKISWGFRGALGSPRSLAKTAKTPERKL
jgi:hypothetical protein